MQDDSSAEKPRNQAVSPAKRAVEHPERKQATQTQGETAGKAQSTKKLDPAEAARRAEQRFERQQRRQQQDKMQSGSDGAANREKRAAGAGRNKPKVSYKSLRAQAGVKDATSAEPRLTFISRDAAQRPAAQASGAKRSSDIATPAGGHDRTDAPSDNATLRTNETQHGPRNVAVQDKSEAQPVTTAKDTAQRPTADRAPQAKAAQKTSGAAARPAAQPAVVQIKPQAGPVRARTRHMILLVSLLVMVVAPVCVGGFYLYAIAVDQYHSTVGFSVRKEESSTPVELLGGITNLSGSSTSDTDILYQFIQSQEMVEAVDEKLDLRTLWSKPRFDPVFALDADVSIEDLMRYWRRMVRISYDGGTGLIELRVLAFDPQDAQDVAQKVFEESSRMINDISAIARQDATRYAQDELGKSVERLKDARLAITQFRSRTQIVDPTTDLQGQMTLLANLQGQLAEALIAMDLLRETTRESDPRITQAQRRIDVIGARIEEERDKIGVSGSDSEGRDYATLFSEYERLAVDREFAEQSYIAALTAYDGALSEAQRQSRYLAAYVQPTKAQTPLYPQKEVLTALLALFCFLVWAILVLVYYSIRDRR